MAFCGRLLGATAYQDVVQCDDINVADSTLHVIDHFPAQGIAALFSAHQQYCLTPHAFDGKDCGVSNRGTDDCSLIDLPEADEGAIEISANRFIALHKADIEAAAVEQWIRPAAPLDRPGTR